MSKLAAIYLAAFGAIISTVLWPRTWVNGISMFVYDHPVSTGSDVSLFIFFSVLAWAAIGFFFMSMFAAVELWKYKK